MAATFQTPSTHNVKRQDHIWVRVNKNGSSDFLWYKCITCGAISYSVPPPSPTPGDWAPDHYEKITDKERAMVPKC